jgi:hypothetical protein
MWVRKGIEDMIFFLLVVGLHFFTSKWREERGFVCLYPPSQLQHVVEVFWIFILFWKELGLLGTVEGEGYWKTKKRVFVSKGRPWVTLETNGYLDSLFQVTTHPLMIIESLNIPNIHALKRWVCISTYHHVRKIPMIVKCWEVV